ncbi:hypothetical protein ISP15_15260 [Dyella jejuensis]|uniref:Uncharacterized protein n=1 Tax=Dyella jejuensis TaxID=1432009 RepID=A0ABW8JKP6_9GAMM
MIYARDVTKYPNDELRFVIYAPRYRDNSGGAIVMHKLCDVLNDMGYSALLYPLWKPLSLPSALFRSPRMTFAYLLARAYRGKYATNAKYNTPLAKQRDIQGSIVIYPEIVSGNPLRAEKYVRWLLHRPGFHEGHFKYSPGDLYFCYQEAFHKNCRDMVHGGSLTIGDTLLDIYKQTNYGERIKTCFIVRKGRARPDLPDLKHQWVVDDLSHEELAKVFNECKFCYLYDTYTAYAQYAAICGCIPIVVPLPGVTKEQWVPEEKGRLGVAYGESDTEHAVTTRPALLCFMQETSKKNREAVAHFVEAVKKHFKT